MVPRSCIMPTQGTPGYSDSGRNGKIFAGYIETGSFCPVGILKR
jgi:hypothetical protein